MFSKGQLKHRMIDQGDWVLRIDELAFTQEIKPFKLSSLSKLSQIPFSLKSNQKVQVTRIYENERDALSAQSLAFDELPWDAKSAKNLPKDTLVDIPIEAMISINATGNWLSKNYQKQEQLQNFLNLSALTHVKGSAQGLILLKGVFRLQILKLNDDWVRIKILLDRTQEASTQVELGGSQQLKAVFIPATKIEKLKSAYLHLSTLAKKPMNWIKKIDQRMDELKFLLAQSSRKIADLKPIENDVHQRLMDTIGDQNDQILEMIDQEQIQLQEINDLMTEKTNQVFGTTHQFIQTKINQLDAYTKRSLDFSTSLQLNAKILDELFFLADLNIKIADEDGATLYNHLFSGSFWEGIHPLQFFAEETQQLDLSLLEDAGKHSDVIQINQMLSGMNQSQSQQLTFKIPLISSSFGQQKILKKLKRQTGTQTETYTYEFFGKSREIEGVFLDEGESISCGTMEKIKDLPIIQEVGTPNSEQTMQVDDHDDDDQSEIKQFFWMTWHRKWHMFEPDPLIKSIDESFTLLGRLANIWQIPQIYNEQISGMSESDIQIIFSKKLLDQLFSLDTDQIWQVLAIVAENFDNQFGIPYLTAWQAPSLNEIASNACETIAYHWGLQYCHLFQDELIIPIINAQQDAKHLDFEFQKNTLKNFYSKTLLNNWTSIRLVTRFLSEIAVEIGQEKELQLIFKHRHPLMPSVVTIDQIGQDQDLFQILNLINPI